MGKIASVVARNADFGSVVFTAHSRGALADDDWEANYLAHIRRLKQAGSLDACANLVFAEGAGPTPRQRAAGSAIFGPGSSYEFRVAVVTDSLLVRGAVTALRWFNPSIDAFGPGDWRRAFAHVRIRPRHLALVHAALRELQREIVDVDILNDVVRGLAEGKAEWAGIPNE